MKMSMIKILMPAFCIASTLAFAEASKDATPTTEVEAPAKEEVSDKKPNRPQKPMAKNFKRDGKRKENKPRPDIEPKGPRNLSIVIDCSAQPKQKFNMMRKFAVNTIKRLSTNDIVSVIVYDGNASVLVPAQAANDKDAIIAKIMELVPKGDAALFAAVSAGASEVRKNLDKNFNNDVMVFGSSVGNIGPSSDEELKTLSDSLGKEKIDLSFGGGRKFRPGDRMPQRNRDGKGKDFKKPRPNKGDRTMPPRKMGKEGKDCPKGKKDAPPSPTKDEAPAK